MATGTLGTSARDYHTRETHYLSSGTLTSGTSGNWLRGASVLIGTIPAGASILRVTQTTTQVDNSGTNKQVSVGTTSTGTDIVATANVGMNALGVTAATVAASSVPVIVAADTQVWVTNQTTGTTATTGIMAFQVEYVVNVGGTSALT